MKQPKPVKNNHPYSWDLVIEDMKARDNFGFKKYGVRLQPFNKRKQLRDLYEELLDSIVYLRTLLYEIESKK